MMLPVLALAVAALAAQPAAAQPASEDIGLLPDHPLIEEPAETPPATLLDRIEAQVRLPAGAQDLATYRRYYAVARGPAERPARISAVYILHAPSPGRQWAREQDLPDYFGGGCGRISFTYDVRRGRLRNLTCNDVR